MVIWEFFLWWYIYIIYVCINFYYCFNLTFFHLYLLYIYIVVFLFTMEFVEFGKKYVTSYIFSFNMKKFHISNELIVPTYCRRLLRHPDIFILFIKKIIIFK